MRSRSLPSRPARRWNGGIRSTTRRRLCGFWQRSRDARGEKGSEGPGRGRRSYGVSQTAGAIESLSRIDDLGFRCPECRNALRLADTSEASRCRECGWVVPTRDGVLDFVSDPERAAEREFYDQGYVDLQKRKLPPTPIESLSYRWHDPRMAPDPSVFKHLGSIRDKRVVLLGNGASDKELFLLTQQPRSLLLSDLSAEAVRAIRDRYRLDDYEGMVHFAAIDALDLPFLDESQDVVYGYAFAHHLSDLDPFLAEVARVLRPGGRAVFMDDAYAPAWQRAKLTVLRPLMRYSHRRKPISPEDLRATLGGGFKEDDLSARIRGLGGEPWFHRENLLFYFWTRAVVCLSPKRFAHLGQHAGITRALHAADRRLTRYRVVQRNLIRMVWGFDKPR
jgi:SAM-dependent methyltransferase